MSRSGDEAPLSYVDVGIEAIVPAFCTVFLALILLDVDDWNAKSAALALAGGGANAFHWFYIWLGYRQVRASKAHEDLVDTFK